MTPSLGQPVPKSRKKNERGFTLLELLVVLTILGLIAMFAVPQAMNFLGGAKTDAAAIQVQNLTAILDLYKLENTRYPNESDGIQALIEQPGETPAWNGPYVKKAAMLIDPWGRTYVYRIPGDHGDFDLYSLGADGLEGGDGEDQDVTSW